jgi:serine/threonine protein kinase
MAMPNPISRKELAISGQWNSYDLKPIGRGVSGLVLVLDDTKVVKIALGSPRSINEIEIERQIYRRFAEYECPFVVKCYDCNDLRGIILERLEECLRARLSRQEDPPTTEDIWKWALQAAEGLAFIHQHQVIQGDVGCHNMMLDAANNLKLCDFSGSSIDGSDACIDYETRSQLPSRHAQPTVQSDIFALGSALYEMATGKPPYHDKEDYQVLNFYNAAHFPDSYPAYRDQRLWDVIKGCWHQEYTTAKAVIKDINQFSPVLPVPIRSCAENTFVSAASGPTADGIHWERLKTQEKETPNPDRLAKRRRRRGMTGAKQQRKGNIFQWIREAITTR